jgi:predicted Rossmann fold nucleotide-binding protein DprA/Smf involved in DNA uptake
VPGNVYSEASVGTDNLIKAGAVPITAFGDILIALKIELSGQQKLALKGSNDAEHDILALLAAGEREGEVLLAKSNLGIVLFSQTLTMLELPAKSAVSVPINGFWPRHQHNQTTLQTAYDV